MRIELYPDIYDLYGEEISEAEVLELPIDFPLHDLEPFMRCELETSPQTVEEICQFLLDCQYMDDLDLYGTVDLWQRPDEFEKMRKGDCEDYAVWAWRHLLRLGLKPRMVMGRKGAEHSLHAWLTYEEKNKSYILEPTYTEAVDFLPMVYATEYQPMLSIKWIDDTFHYYRHKKTKTRLSVTASLNMNYDLLRYQSGSKVRAWFLFVTSPIIYPILNAVTQLYHKCRPQRVPSDNEKIPDGENVE